MEAIKGKNFKVGREYKIDYYANGYLKTYKRTAKLVRLQPGKAKERKAIFAVGGKDIEYIVDEEITPMEIGGKACLVSQEVAVMEYAKINPQLVEKKPYGVIYANNEVERSESSPVEYVTVKEYADYHGVSPVSVRQKITRGNLPAIKDGRDWKIDKNEPYLDYRKSNKN